MKKDKWTQGFVCAIVILIQLDGLVTTQTKEAFRAGLGNISLLGLAQCGVDVHDLKLLKKHWKGLK